MEWALTSKGQRVRSCWRLLPVAAKQLQRDLKWQNPFHVGFNPKVISEVARSWGEEGHIVKKSLWVEVKTFPLPRKLSGRAVKIWTCISLLYYVSQERKCSFFKNQRIYFLSPQSESHSVSVNYQQEWAVLCVFGPFSACQPNSHWLWTFNSLQWQSRRHGRIKGRVGTQSSHLASSVMLLNTSGASCNVQVFLRQGTAHCSTACSPLPPQSLLYCKRVVLHPNAQRYVRARPDLVH